jgi:hypothetical protein
MRAAFDTTMNVYFGDPFQNVPPATPAVHLGIPCRVVDQTQITYADPILNDMLWWVTHNVGFVTGAAIAAVGPPPELFVVAWRGNILEILDGSGRWFQVMWVQDVVPSTGVPYARSVVMPYPLPF